MQSAIFQCEKWKKKKKNQKINCDAVVTTGVFELQISVAVQVSEHKESSKQANIITFNL